jgi:glycosyltransferase involved in cell wall biosynthesis
MKYLLISGIYRPEIGGPATYLPTLAKALIKQSNQVEVITLKNSSAPAKIENWPVNYVTRDQNLFIRFIKTVRLIIQKAKPTEAIFSNGLIQETAVALMFIKRKSVAKVVGDPVWERARNKGLTKLSINEFNDSKLKINHRFQRWLICWSLNRFDHITCPSLELKSLMQGWGVVKPIELIPNGVDLTSSSTENKVFDLISVCRLVSWKNLDKLVIASAKAKTRLAIAGSGTEESKLKALALSTSSDVTFLGQLEEQDVIKALQKSKVFALLSDYEGLSFSLLQAMACGLPSIVSNAKGNTDVITNNSEGIVVDIKNQDNIVAAIQQLLAEPEKMTSFGLAASKKVESDYLQINQVNKVIKLLISGKSA